MVTILADLIANQTDPTLAPYAKTGEVTLRLSTKASNQEEANQALDILENQILDHQTSKEFLYETSVMVMERRLAWASIVVEELKKQGKTITAAESLTAGLFQATVADFSGVSSIF